MPAGVANQVNVYFFVCVCARALAISLLVKTARMSQKQLVQDKHWLGHMFTIDKREIILKEREGAVTSKVQ